MRYKYDTKRIGNKHYIFASRLIDHSNDFDYILTFPKPFDKDIVDERFKLQWRIEANPNYDKTKKSSFENTPVIFIKDPLPSTTEEIEAEKNVAIRKAIHENYLIDDEIKFINRILEQLPDLPLEYLDYRNKVKGIIKSQQENNKQED